MQPDPSPRPPGQPPHQPLDFALLQQATAGQGQRSRRMLWLMLGLLGWMMFSQRKQQQNRANELSQIKKGDEIVTIGGLYGIVDEINDQKVVLDVDGVYLTFDRSAIRNRVSEAAPTAQVEAAIEGPTEESDSAIEE